MARHQVTLTMIPAALAEGLRLALELKPEGAGQMAAQREIVASLQTALDARRQRIIVSESSLDWVKWSGLILQAIVTLVAIAFVHSDNRTTAALALGLFATRGRRSRCCSSPRTSAVRGCRGGRAGRAAAGDAGGEQAGTASSQPERSEGLFAGIEPEE